MLEQLISLTNSEDFFSNWHLTMEQLLYVPETETLKFVVQTVKDYDDDIEKTRKFWEIECTEVVADRITRRIFIPYTFINVLDEHALLWEFEATRYLTLQGEPKSVSQLIGDLFLLHVKISGNWLDFNHLFRAVYNLLPNRGNTLIEMPERLISKYKGVFEKHEITFTEEAGQTGETDLKVLFFGNNDISPNDYNFYQPYVIAKHFTAKLVAPNIGLPRA